MGSLLAQFADLDWTKVVVIGIAALPLVLLVVIIVFGLFGWVLDPKTMWRKRK